MRQIDGKICLTRTEVVDVCKISINYLKKRNSEARKDSSKSWQPLTVDNVQYVLLDSIPFEYHQTIVNDLCRGLQPLAYIQQLEAQSRLNTKEESRHILQAKVVIDPTEKDELIRLTHEYKSFGLREANIMALACAYARFYNEATTTNIRQLGFDNKVELRGVIAQIAKDDHIKPLDISDDRLKRKLTKYKKEGWKALLSGRYGNENTKIVGKKASKKGTPKEFHEAELMALYMNEGDPQKFRQTEAYFRYITVCGQHGIMPVSMRTAQRFWSSEKVQAAASKERHGAKYADDMFRPYVKREKASAANVFISGDGVTCDVYYMKGGKVRTMMSMWIWVDWFSGAIVGFDIDYHENSDMVRRATRNMLDMNGGRVPIEYQSDNSSAFKSHENMELMNVLSGYSPLKGRSVSLARVGNAKTKPVERVIPILNDIFRNYPNWKGCNITSNHIDSKANPDELKRVNLPDEEGVRWQIFEVVQIYNNTVVRGGKSRIELYNENIHTHSQTVSELERCTLFDTTKIIAIRRGFVQVNHLEYEVPEYHNLLATDRVMNKGQVRAYYDIDHIERVLLFNFTDKKDKGGDMYLCECQLVSKPNGAKYDQTEEDGQKLGHLLKRGEEFDQWQQDEARKAQETLDALAVASNPFTTPQNRYKNELNTGEALLAVRRFEESEKLRKLRANRKTQLEESAIVADNEQGLYGGKTGSLKPIDN